MTHVMTNGNPRLGMHEAALVAAYAHTREMLQAALPDEDLDDLIDTLDGETELPDVIARMVRDAREAAANEAALGVIMKEMSERKARFGHREAKLREAVLTLMQAAEMRKLDRPDFTASVGAGRPSVKIDDEDLLPDDYFVVKATPDRTKIGEALKSGHDVPGAHMEAATPTLTVRVR